MGAKMQDEEDATLSLQLLGTAAEAGEDDVAPHVPAITAAVQGEILRHIPPHPEPWPQVCSLAGRANCSSKQTLEYVFFLVAASKLQIYICGGSGNFKQKRICLGLQIVELGFSALASLAQTWDSFEPEEPDEDEDESETLTSWKVGCTGLANTFSHILQQAWLTPSQVWNHSIYDKAPLSCVFLPSLKVGIL